MAGRNGIRSWSEFVTISAFESSSVEPCINGTTGYYQFFIRWLRRLVTHLSCAKSFRTAMTSSRSWTAYSFVVALAHSQILLTCILLRNWVELISLYFICAIKKFNWRSPNWTDYLRTFLIYDVTQANPAQRAHNFNVTQHRGHTFSSQETLICSLAYHKKIYRRFVNSFGLTNVVSSTAQ